MLSQILENRLTVQGRKKDQSCLLLLVLLRLVRGLAVTLQRMKLEQCCCLVKPISCQH